MALFPSFQRAAILVLLAFSTPGQASGDNEDEPSCTCFTTSGSSSSFFANHLFFDFRAQSQHATIPDIISDPELATSAPPTTEFFRSESWEEVWGIQYWNNSDLGDKPSDGTLFMVNSPSNIYIEQDDDDSTYMTMRTARLDDFQSSAEFESVSSQYQFLSVRMRARTVGAPGACTAMFTYREAEDVADVQEADIEFLTRDPDVRVQYTNQPSFTEDGDDVADATRNVTIPDGKTVSDWAVHRLDWTPGMSTWYVDGEEVASIGFQAPRDASRVVFNSWSDGGSWSGVMEVGEAAYLQIQWIEMVFNMTEGEGYEKRGLDPRGDEGCEVVCGIDEEDSEPGVPVLVSFGRRLEMHSWLPGLGVVVATVFALQLWF